MEFRRGTKTIGKSRKKAIIEFVFDEYVIYVFQGELSQFDILVKYTKKATRIRTPKHVHWAVDILMKMQGDEKLTKAYLSAIQKCWDKCVPLKNNDYETLKALIKAGEKEIEIEKYSKLNQFGEYNVEFLYVLMELLAVQEKTNNPNAYMFGRVIHEIMKEDRDIFKIVSTAVYGGRR